jgi:type IV pilus assembly protein PilA
MPGHQREEGFTLIELMVVMLIIAILIAMAIPTFLGARRRAQDTQAKSHLRAALVAEKTYFASALSYTNDNNKLIEIEPGLAWGTGDANARGVIIENLSGNDENIVLRSLSRSGSLFCLADTSGPHTGAGYASIAGAGTWYSKKDNSTSSSDCTGLLWETTSVGWS